MKKLGKKITDEDPGKTNTSKLKAWETVTGVKSEGQLCFALRQEDGRNLVFQQVLEQGSVAKEGMAKEVRMLSIMSHERYIPGKPGEEGIHLQKSAETFRAVVSPSASFPKGPSRTP